MQTPFPCWKRRGDGARRRFTDCSTPGCAARFLSGAASAAPPRWCRAGPRAEARVRRRPGSARHARTSGSCTERLPESIREACAREGVIFFTRGDPPRVEPVRGEAFIVVASVESRAGRTARVAAGRTAQEHPAIDPLLDRLERWRRKRVSCSTGPIWSSREAFRRGARALRRAGRLLSELERIGRPRKAGARARS